MVDRSGAPGWKFGDTEGEVKEAYAKLAGFVIGGFDPLRDQIEANDEREAAMVDALVDRMRHMRDGHMIVVQAGAYHLPYLHDKLADSADVKVISVMQCFEPMSGDGPAIERLDAALQTPGILKVRHAPETEQQPFDALEIIGPDAFDLEAFYKL